MSYTAPDFADDVQTLLADQFGVEVLETTEGYVPVVYGTHMATVGEESYAWYSALEKVVQPMPSGMVKMWQVSLTHIRKSTHTAMCKEMTDRGFLPENLTFVPWASHGWIVWVHTEPGMDGLLVDAGFSDLARLMEEARSLGAEYVQIDSAAGVIDGLPTCEW